MDKGTDREARGFAIVRLMPEQGECFFMGSDLNGDWWTGNERHARVFASGEAAENYRLTLTARWKDALEVRETTGAQP